MKIYTGEFTAKTKRGEPKVVIRAASPNRPHLEQTMARGIKWHCQHLGVDPAPWLQQFYEGAWDMRIFDSGVPQCGSWPIHQPGLKKPLQCLHAPRRAN